MRPMTAIDSTGIRGTLARALDWGDAHATLDQAVDGLPFPLQGERPVGWDHSPWQLLEHLRLTLDDLRDFAVNPAYEHTRAWPADYWPADPAPPDASAWAGSVAAIHDSLARLQALARDEGVDLTARVPTGTETQTYLRTLLLVLDHNAYHVGQLVALRRVLGAWA